ncbi:MAG: DUF1572 domain-containing protein [Vicinamibacterales bacterium]|nr:DUF1572 domain-containing protein [Vicinamibacterales bacterium]
MIARAFTDKSRHLLATDYLPKIESCLHRLSEEDVWWRPNEASNSVGNLILHLCGNVTMWIVGGVGQRLFERNRQQEFDERRHIPKEELRTKLRGVVDEADAIIESLDERALLNRRSIQGYDVSVLEAVYHVVEHFGMHTGQIILLSKARLAGDLRLWQQPDDRTSL